MVRMEASGKQWELSAPYWKIHHEGHSGAASVAYIYIFSKSCKKLRVLGHRRKRSEDAFVVDSRFPSVRALKVLKSKQWSHKPGADALGVSEVASTKGSYVYVEVYVFVYVYRCMNLSRYSSVLCFSMALRRRAPAFDAPRPVRPSSRW